MKRRDFMIATAGSAGLLLFDRARAATPCPPSLQGTTASCGPVSAEADWQARIAGRGVVWYHDFRNPAEVENFRWAGGLGNDPNDRQRPGTVNWIEDGGITGDGCLETLRRAGSEDGATWWRPFSPFRGAGNGRGTDDPGAGGTIAPKEWQPTDGGSQTAGWRAGYYGNEIYHNSGFDGTEYYLQARVKLHPHRAEEPTGGKLFYFTRTDRSLTSQELVTISRYSGSERTEFAMYRSGSPGLWTDPPFEHQPNSDFPGMWAWPLGTWVTILYHVKGGTNANGEEPEGGGEPTGNPDTLVQVWVDWDGTKKVNEYIKIWDQPTVRLPFDVIGGHNALIASGYMNGQTFSQDIWQRYDQIIFSKELIPCPQV